MNWVLLLYFVAIAPKLLWDRFRKGKRHPGLAQRLGLSIPQVQSPLIWIHAVSVGEVKAAQPLFRKLRLEQPKAFFLVTTTTATGQIEAKRSLPEAHAFAYLPLDFSWVVRKWVKQLQPRLFLLIESDFWPNLLAALKKHGTRIVLASGKMSDRSARRLKRFSTFAKQLFSHFDHICVQSEEQYSRFVAAGADPSRLHVTGNLKLDMTPEPITPLNFPQPAITISCTHSSEEEQILDALQGGPWFLILAPRHPERFEDIARLLEKKKIPFSRWSQPSNASASVLLLDAMGQLPSCYAHSRLAIVAGSYVAHIGGHNILEPCLYGTPVFFGPYTHAQTELTSRALRFGAGQVAPLEQLRQAVCAFFDDPLKEQAMRQAVGELIAHNRGVVAQTIGYTGSD